MVERVLFQPICIALQSKRSIGQYSHLQLLPKPNQLKQFVILAQLVITLHRCNHIIYSITPQITFPFTSSLQTIVLFDQLAVVIFHYRFSPVTLVVRMCLMNWQNHYYPLVNFAMRVIRLYSIMMVFRFATKTCNQLSLVIVVPLHNDTLLISVIFLHRVIYQLQHNFHSTSCVLPQLMLIALKQMLLPGTMHALDRQPIPHFSMLCRRDTMLPKD